MRRSRSSSGRDAATIEIVYAAAAGAVLAAIGFLALASPVLAGQAHGEARKGWFTAAVIVAAAAFCGRVAVTLRRFERQNRLREQAAEQSAAGGDPAAVGAASPGAGGQPSQPGLTSPDS
jgi:hypothetical protein